MTALRAVQGDITKLEVDVIVNAANSSLMGGGGVDGAIHRAGGPEILRECQMIVKEHGPLPTGQAVITAAGRLPARHVIHTVGPIWGQVSQMEATDLLASCYTNSLQLAVDHHDETIGFPNISTGVYGFPKDEAAGIATGVVRDWVEANPDAITEVTFVCFDEENLALYRSILGD